MREGKTSATLNVHMAPFNTGTFIGGRGRTARSLRMVLSAAGTKVRRRYVLSIEEESREELNQEDK
ncbi:KH domain-containing protein [Granulicella cerasi]|uniref:KH domain-containing protein n=1 Tax=Granulicella cerasi TaxID=741063 RepID=A0ABW1ZE42_9BACT